jgi:cytoskeleton protein RodZ
MSSLGLYLRGLREAKGMALEDIARSTRVGRRHLEALESDTLGELPAPVFVKGFIRAYCAFLECPPNQALDLYRESSGEPALTHGPMRPLSSRSSRAGPLLISIILFLALGVSLVVLRIGLQSSREATVAPPLREEAQKTPTPAPSPSPVKPTAVTPAPTPAAPATSATPGSAATVVTGPPTTPPPAVASTSAPTAAPPTRTAPAETKPGTHHLLVRAVEPTWLRVQVDDGQVAEELLQAGAVREWNATKRFTLTVGNAGGVEIDLNGTRLPTLGAKGTVIQRLVLPQEQAGTGS